MNKTIKAAIEKNGGILSTSEIVALGFSKMTVTKYVQAGELKRIAHGIYAENDAIYDEMHALCLGCPKIIFSHETALWLNGLTDRDPLVYSITLPKRSRVNIPMLDNCICRNIKKELYETGLTWKKTVFGNIVRCYDAERTLCDMVRNENDVDIGLMVEGLKRYASSKNRKIANLLAMADLFEIGRQMQRYMWVLA